MSEKIERQIEDLEKAIQYYKEMVKKHPDNASLKIALMEREAIKALIIFKQNKEE